LFEKETVKMRQKNTELLLVKYLFQSLKEIKTFDKSRVVPKQYVNWLSEQMRGVGSILETSI